LSLLAVVGMTIRQLPSFAFRSAGDYANAMADLHARYDPVFGAGIVRAMERLQVFHIFSSTWFTVGLIILVVSIIVCTLDRTPRLWRQSAEIRVVQPDEFYDPELPDRAAMIGVDAAAVTRTATGDVEGISDEGRTLEGAQSRVASMLLHVAHRGRELLVQAPAIRGSEGGVWDRRDQRVGEMNALTVELQQSFLYRLAEGLR
jgi:hypothetical protein